MLDKYDDVRPLIILNIIMAFWYCLYLGKFDQLSWSRTSFDRVKYEAPVLKFLKIFNLGLTYRVPNNTTIGKVGFN